MREDPVVAEVRKARKDIFRECGNDPGKFFKMLRDGKLKQKSRPAGPALKRGTRLVKK